MEAVKTDKIKRIALIGAGLSNLTFLYSLKSFDNVQVNIFERSKVLSGRAATRIREEYYFDNGANYFNISDPKISKIILDELNTDNLIEIKKWIFPFDKYYKINFDENQAIDHNKKIKYTYTNGIRSLGELLLKNAQINFNIEFSKNITKITQLENSNWRLYSENENLGDFDYIIFGVPSPNIARVLHVSQFSIEDKDFFSKSTDILMNNTYKKIFSLAIAYNKKDVGDEFNKFFALINSDRENPISWISIENEKNRPFLERNENLILIIQMSDEFSTSNQNLEKDVVLKGIIEHLNKLFPNLINKKIKFYDLKLWGHALPKWRLSETLVQQLAEKNIFIIGDSLIGKGRVDEAMLTGINLYERLKAKF